MKKGLKALVALVAAGALLMSMSFATFAATYTTETEYASGDDTKVTVRTVVTGVADGEEVAFLVTSNNDSSIVWVDQKAATGTTAEFSFTTDAADAKDLGSTIQVGTTSIAAGDFGADKEDLVMLADYKASFSVNGTGGRVYAVGGSTGTIATSGAVSTDNTVTFVCMPDAGYALSDIKKDGVSETLIGATNVRSFTLAADTVFEFTFTAVAANDATATYTGTTLTPVEADNVKTVSIPATVTNAKEFGILVAKTGSEDVDKLTALTAQEIAALDATSQGITKFAALGANEEGTFIISLGDQKVGNAYKVFDGTNEYTGVVYAINNNVAYSSTFTFGK